MSLNNIKLPESVITALYRQPVIPATEFARQSPGAVIGPLKEPVIEVPEPVKTTAPGKQSDYRFLGNNLRHIAIIVHYPDEVFLPDAHLQFLTKILGACKLNLGDVAILNHATVAIDISKLKKQLKPKHLILFGIDPVDIKLPIRFPEFKEQEYADTIYLLAPTPDVLNQENKDGRLQKSKLWLCLQKMFPI
jgi:hypothetical protein